MTLSGKIIMVVTAILATVLAIYLTPLKNLNLIEPKINTVEPNIFYDLYKNNPDDYIFIDVRSENAYQTIHASGSINVSLHTLYDERHVLPKHDKTIVLICSGNRASRVGYSYLEHYGFLNLMQVEGGIENWQQEGLPVVDTSSL